MSAFQLGPIVLSAERFYAALAILTFLVIAEWLSRSKKQALGSWSVNALMVLLLGARLGFVLLNLKAYAAKPLSIFYLWQGGFAPFWGIVAALLYSAWYFRKDAWRLRWALLPVLFAISLWLALPFVVKQMNTEAITSLPALSLEQLNGESLELNSFTGKPIIINLWATWCGPCRRELPMMAELARTRSDVIFLFIDQGETRERIASYLTERNLELENVLLDTRSELGDLFRSPGLPTTLFFKADGGLVKTHVGEISSAALFNAINDLNREASSD
jgi:thiol-disulfide isomerase/thioredoxin